MKTATRRNCLAAFALLSFAIMGGTRVTAAQMQASLSSREAYVGVPVTLQIEINNARSHEPPEVPSIVGTVIKSAGPPRRSNQTTIINGQISQRSSVTYVWQITPQREGKFTVPPLRAKVDGRFETTEPLQFVATKSETGDLLFVEVSGQQEKVYVGQPLELRLKIWIKPYRDSQYSLTLSEGDMWQMVAEQTNWGAFAERMKELGEQNKRLGGKEVLRADSNGNERSYFLYEIDATIYPKRSGRVNAGDVQIVVNYPTRLARGRDPFSSFFDDNDFPFGNGSPFSGRGFSPFNRQTLTVADYRPLVAGAKVDAIDVMPIPTKGRPRDYRGAVGNYQIMTQAVPTMVKAGDPITLHIGITGTGPMELVRAPPLASLRELTKDFKVPDEPLAGIVQDDAKLFTVSIRPRREGITTIPGIPLTFFDPKKEEFVTVRSEPITIQVEKADTLALGAIVGGGNRAGFQSGHEPDQQEGDATIRLENFSGNDILRSSQPLSLRYFVVALLAPPVLFFGFVIVRSWRRLGIGFRKLSFAAATSAYRALDSARGPADVAHAVLGYIARRLHSNPTTLSRNEAVALLEERGISTASHRIDQLLEQCEQLAYAGISSTDNDSLVRKAKECIRWLSQQKFTSVE